MNIDKTKISGLQFMLLIACFIQASGLLSSFVAMVLMQESWIAVLVGSIVLIPIILLYKKLIIKFPKQNLFEIFDIVFGKVIGKIISSFFLFYFVMITLLNISDMAGFTKLTLMNRTPDIIIVGLSVFISAIAIKHGIKAISRYTVVFLSFSMFVLIVTTLLLMNQFDFTNFLPIFAQEPIRYVQGLHSYLTIPTGEFVMFLMFTKNVKIKKKDWNKYLFGGFFLGILLLFTVKIRDIALLGNVYHILALPQLISLKLVNLGDALSRMEVLFSVVLILMLFFKITLLMYVTLIAFCHFFKIVEYWRLIPMLAIMLVVLSSIYTGYNSEMHLIIGRQSVPFVLSLFEHIIPFLTLFIAVISKKTTEKTFGQTQAYLKNPAIKNFKKIKPKIFKKEVRV